MSFARAFNRNRPLHYLMAVVLGVSSGFYLFNEPLKRHYEEQAKQLAEQQAAEGGAAPAAAAAATPAAGSKA